ESRYRGGDGVWRNTRLNRNFLINALGGKEWKTGRSRQNIFGANIRCTYQGGDRYIPADIAASQAQHTFVQDDTRAYTERLKNAFIAHLTLSYKINRRATAHEIALKMINVTGYKEFWGINYNHRTNQPELFLQAVSFPNLSYKIEF
ncbi:MAG: prevent-host-death protein, partial [Tannerella sp.]|nr:prevent-host-death protein [Tannerella sp.]